MDIEERIYLFIWNYWRDNGYSPTKTEIRVACRLDWDELATALAALQADNIIAITPGAHRGIHIVQKTPT